MTDKKEVKDTSNVERDILYELAFEVLKEKKRQRRWRLMRRALSALVLVVIIWLIMVPGQLAQSYKPHAAVVQVEGVIANSFPANSEAIIESLESAFDNANTKGVLLQINSPGGSPVQSAYVYKAISRLKESHPDKKVYAVCADACTSGAYYIAAAADEIYADPASLVGSIGVVSSGFGFVDGMQKLGIERRLFTAGDRKGFMDPFSKLDPDDVQHLKQMLSTVHEQFIHAVKQSRGNRLKTDEPKLFSGLPWTGERAKQLGLIDGFGTPEEVAKEKLKTDVLVDYTQEGLTPWSLFTQMGSILSRQLKSMLLNSSGFNLFAVN